MSRLPKLLAWLPIAVAGAAFAQFKVVDADGRVTYTDRPPAAANATIKPLRGGAPAATAAAADTGLPYELRQLNARYPVTLYATEQCPACDDGRRFLQQRGVPYSERRIVTDADIVALERLSSGRTVPTLTIGTQVVRGMSEPDWAAYLDAAGYPRGSRLPRGWQPPPVQPMTQAAAAPAAPAETPRAAPETPAAPPAVPLPPPPEPGSIRF
jgi:glutaredoxin